jgi:hypothetical protein
MGSGREVHMSKNTSLIWQISFNGQRCDLQIHHCFLNDRPIACSWYIKNRKSRVRDRFISYSKYSRRGTLFIQKKVGSALTETENWDLLVDFTSRDGRQMLDAGVHLSDKRTLLMKTHIPFQTQYKIFYRIRFCFYKWWRNNRFYYF